MIIIKIMGGFASQLNKYLTGCIFAQYMETELVLDISDYYDGYFRPYSLCYIAMPDVRLITNTVELNKINCSRNITNSYEMEKMILSHDAGVYYISREESDYLDFFNKYPQFKVENKSDILSGIRMRENSRILEDFRKEIQDRISVGVHIRRGDFVSLGRSDTLSFYQAAVHDYSSRFNNVHFYFFSNDQNWVQEHFGFEDNFHYVKINHGFVGDVEEFFCLASCQYRILTKFSGYGILANMIGCSCNSDSYAVMSGEITQNVSVRKNEENLVASFEQNLNAYKEEGNTVNKIHYLSTQEIDRGADAISQNQKNENRSKKTKVNNTQLFEKQAMVSVREQLEYSSVATEYTEQLGEKWQQEYGIYIRKKATVWIISGEHYSKWFRRGLFELAIMLSRMGCQVFYSNRELEQSDMGNAHNMDGENYWFQLVPYPVSKSDVDAVLGEADYQDKLIITDRVINQHLYENIKISKVNKSRSGEYYIVNSNRLFYKNSFLQLLHCTKVWSVIKRIIGKNKRRLTIHTKESEVGSAVCIMKKREHVLCVLINKIWDNDLYLNASFTGE